ncbi:hypothetical protein CRM22_010067 [Opisthorchis felineus]|uniref:Homeobox domain-containing protein n=1 Tax=Opisthorchis felineus TaxID=147828 RepID=A0A4S2L8C6_OPIFE|nr:hypothetical protein CRM22_010067 [Opisthorchis felineus]
MSAILGGPSILSRDVNPYIPDLLRTHPGSGFIGDNLNSYRRQPQPDPTLSPRCSPSPSPHVADSNAFLSTARHVPVESILNPSTGKAQDPESRTHPFPPTPPAPPVCIRCRDPIMDHYLFRIRGQAWHEACAVCSVCTVKLSDVCFVHEGQLFCRKDYDRLHATRCITCRQPMRSHELFMRAHLPPSPSASTAEAPRPPLLFHVSCFTCFICLQPLVVGDPYTIDPVSFRPICRADFLAAGRTRQHSGASAQQQPPLSPYQSQTSNEPNPLRRPRETITEVATPSFSHACESTDVQWKSERLQTSTHVGGTSKRMRTSLTDDQRLHMQRVYESNPRPSKEAREKLANELGVPLRVVQVWFQNQRARDRRASVQNWSNDMTAESDWRHASLSQTSPGRSPQRCSVEPVDGF